MSSAAIELYFNDVGTRLLDKRFYDGFYEEFIERQTAEKKWGLLPRLVANHKMEKRDQTMLLMSSTFEVRNKLMHPKVKSSSSWDIEGKKPEDVPGTPEYLLEAATKAIKALDALYSETIHWNDQIHALDHLLGREHPRYDDEHQRLLIATQENVGEAGNSDQAGDDATTRG